MTAPTPVDTAITAVMESHMFKSNTRFLAFANVILAAIPLIGLFAVGYSTAGTGA